MFERHDVYKVKMQIHYLLEYLDAYIQSYHDYNNYREGKMTNLTIPEIHNITNPNFYINMEDSQFKTKYFFCTKTIKRITTSMELQRILKHCGFELNAKSREYLFLQKNEAEFSKVTKIKTYLMKVLETKTDMLNNA